MPNDYKTLMVPGTFKLITFLVFHYVQTRESKVSTGFSSGDYKVHRNGCPKRNEKTWRKQSSWKNGTDSTGVLSKNNVAFSGI